MELAGQDGQLAWVGHYRAWGKLTKASDGHGNPSTTDNPLRFQGQYLDEETGLHYNRHRYYDPETGRFTTQDPIGLAGGENLYMYAPNPTGWVDPLGLSGCRSQCRAALEGKNWEFNPEKDLDLRGTGKSHHDGLTEAFRRTGVPREQFEVTKWGTDVNGKSVPVEWQAPNGANVNMDIPEWNNVGGNGGLGNGPHAPHIGYQVPGKPRSRGHIFVDNIPATRR
ncbi:MAG: hypothetical protein GYB17_06855 [Gammaproteobacteria bacterium]|nr:hypothetical protein [Gammaproteobacteria bacterium]